jgi:hypothetical protein
MNCDCTIIKGPVGIEWNGIKFLTEGEVTIRSNIEAFDVSADHVGTFDKRLTSLAYTIAFKPLGVSGVVVSLLTHIAGLRPGQDLFTDEGIDLPLVITPLTDQGFTLGKAGEILTFKKVALTGIPGLKLSTSAQMIDTLTFTAIKSTGVEQNVDDAYYSRAPWTSTLATAFITAASVDEADVLTSQWACIWQIDPTTPVSGDPWADFESVDGIAISFDRQSVDTKTDNCGWIGTSHTGMTAKITLTPCLTAAAVAATTTLTITAQPTNNDTIEIGGRTYRFRDTLAAIDDIKISAVNLAATLLSIQKTINGTGVAGTDMFTGTTINAHVTAGTPGATTIVMTAKVAGEEANDITTTNPVDTGTVITWTGATLSGGTGSRLENILLGHPFHNETAGVPIGGALNGTSRKLKLVGSDQGNEFVIEFQRVNLTATGIRYGAQPLRQGEVEFTATQKLSGDFLTAAVDS